MQTTVVAEFHELVAQSVGEMATVAVIADDAKLKPCMVTYAREVGALTGVCEETNGDSYEKASAEQPTTAEIVTAMRCPEPCPAEVLHLTAVAELHKLLAHNDNPIRIDGVRLFLAKFNPMMVTDKPSVVGPFSSCPLVSTGLS